MTIKSLEGAPESTNRDRFEGTVGHRSWEEDCNCLEAGKSLGDDVESGADDVEV